MEIDYNKIHSKCGWHEKSIIESKFCGCFHCLSIFKPTEIVEWITENKDYPRGPGKTAVCPICGIDSVLPDDIELEITKEFLEKMQDIFFD